MNKLSPEERRQLAKEAAAARWNNRKVTTAMSNKDRELIRKSASEVTTQLSIPGLNIEKQIEIDGIGMGVLSDGTAFLTSRGLSRLCGVTHPSILGLSEEWYENPPKARVASIKSILSQRGITLANPYLEIVQRNTSFFAYSDAMCLAVLEYYAFEAGANIKPQAVKNFRLLAGKALRDFILTQLGYDPTGNVPDVWRQFHDRIALTYNSVPNGYFGIFKEMADMIVTLGQSGLQISKNFVPDISVGAHWSKHWSQNRFDEKYGSRLKFEHNYPDYFPQSRSNPQEPWCYPDAALGEFRRWMREVYIDGGKFEHYLAEKIRQRELSASFAQLAIAAYGLDIDEEEALAAKKEMKQLERED